MEYKTILVYGSLAFSGEAHKKRQLAELLGEKIISHANWRIMTGGAIGEGDGKTKGGVDFHAAIGAQRLLNDSILEFHRIITILPNNEVKDVFKIGMVCIDNVKDIAERRQKLIERADAVITIEGGRGTVDIIKYALDFAIPVIPLGGTGGVSSGIWNMEHYKDPILASLRLSADDPRIKIIKNQLDSSELVVGTCLEILEKCLVYNCDRCRNYRRFFEVKKRGIF